MKTEMDGTFREFFTGYTRYFYEDTTVGSRSSVTEHDQDFQIRKEMWKIGVGDIVIDCGAGFGSYTLPALADAAGFVYAFEQDQQMVDCIRRNLQVNRLLMATERATVTRVYLEDATNTVDKYAEQLSYPLNRLDWIKIDVGDVPNNRLILWGCKKTIKQFKPSILIADPEPPPVSFLSEYKTAKILNGHSLLVPIR